MKSSSCARPLLGRIAKTMAGLAAMALAAPASAGLMLSKVIVDLPAGMPPREDIELWNTGGERMYVTAEPAQIIDAGKPTEQRVQAADPSQSGLLVTPQKLVIEPDERKLLRIASIVPAADRERIYRVTVKPVAGSIIAGQSALKVFVGYDVLVVVRPASISGDISGARQGRELTLHNGSNSSVEIAEGKQCDAGGSACAALPATRLYAGADWTVALPGDGPVTFRIIRGTTQTERRFD